MNTETNMKEILAEIDALLSAGDDAKTEKGICEAISAYTEANPENVVGQSVLLNELGGFYRSRGIYDKGEAAYLKAKALLEKIQEYACLVEDSACCGGDADEKQHAEVVFINQTGTQNYATTLNNLAGLYRMDGKPQKASETFDAAITVYENCEDEVAPDYLASVYSNKGLVSLDLGDPAGARTMFLKAKAILEAGGEYPFALGTTISNLGFAAVMERQYAEAEEYFEAAKILFESCGAEEMIKNCADILGRLGARK